MYNMRKSKYQSLLRYQEDLLFLNSHNVRICNQLLLNILQVISQKYGHNL